MENVNKKILLVEDDLNFGAVLKDYLMLNDFDVTLAKNGMEGFEKFKKDTYDLCILDVMMPYKDGYTLAKEIRESNEKIVFIGPCIAKKMEAYKIGKVDYVLTFEELASLFAAKGIEPSQLENLEVEGSFDGWNFAQSGGVANAVVNLCKKSLKFNKIIKMAFS